VMVLAADRDLIARQYTNDFAEVFGDVPDALLAGLRRSGSLEEAIIEAHLCLMRDHPDTLIARKAGPEVAAEAARRAGEALQAGGAAVAEFDTWLRADGRRRNPGTTADLLTAGLFVLLRQGQISIPMSW